MEGLQECGLSGGQLEKASRYINGEVESCDLGITVREPYLGQNFVSRNQKLEKCFQRLRKHEEQELAVRFFNVLFQIFGVNMVQLYNRLYGVRNAFPADARIALEATACFTGNMGRTGAYLNIQMISQKKEDLVKALKYTDKKDPGADFCILSTLFYTGKENPSWNGKALRDFSSESKGFLQKLSGFLTGEKEEYASFESNEYVRAYQQEYRHYMDLFPEILFSIFPGAFSEEGKRKVREYLLNGDAGNPSSQQIVSVLSGATMNEYSAKSFISLAVINYRLSLVGYRFLKLCLASAHMERVLDLMNDVPFRNNMGQELLRWRTDFELDDMKFIKWLAKCPGRANVGKELKDTSIGRALYEMTKLAPEVYLEAVKNSGTGMQDNLVSAARSMGEGRFYKARIEPLLLGEKAGCQQKVIREIVPDVDPALKAAAEAFLKGEGGISALYGHETELFGKSSYLNVSAPLLSYVKVYGQDGFYERGVAFIGIRCLEYTLYAFCKEGDHCFSMEAMRSFLNAMKAGKLDTGHRLKVASILQDSYWGKADEKKKTMEQLFAADLEENREEALEAFRNGPVNGRLIGITLLSKDCARNKAELLAYLSESSKQVKAELVTIYAAHDEWMEDFLQVLKRSKKSAEREMAATVLGKYSGIMKHQEELQTVLTQEKSKKVLDLVRDILRAGGTPGMEQEVPAEGTTAQGGKGVMTVDAYVMECHKGGKKRVLTWITDRQDYPMPAVHFLTDANAKEGAEQEASEQYLQAVLLAYSGMPTPGLNQDVRILTDRLNKQELAAYMESVFDLFLGNGAEAKKKWVLYATSIHGGSRIVARLKHQIDEWAEHSRGAMAAEAVKALTLNDSPTALLYVDGIARKYKFKQVRKAAQDAMAYAAAQLGLTVEELADRIVPDLGFDEKLERHFDYGSRTFTVKIAPNLDIEVKDENGKKIKSLPAVGKNDDEAKATEALLQFKELKKQMKTTVKNQALRLDLAMSMDRRWTVENWKKLFVKNPIMHQFAISLIWGHYQDEQLLGTFRYMEDGTFNTVDEEEYELGEEGKVGLIHPIELTKETIDSWKQQLSDYEITQAVEQLDRPVFRVTQEEKGQRSLERFGGKVLNGLSLAGKLTNFGWSKGSPEDAGIYYSYYRKDIDAGYGVELQFSGAYIGDENDEVTVYDAEFYELKDFDGRGYRYSRLKNQEKKSIALDKVSPRYFSEIVNQIGKATASSTEMDEDWREDR